LARDVLSKSITLDRIVCHEEGDGWSSAEPYLWTSFYRIDGGGVAVNDVLPIPESLRGESRQAGDQEAGKRKRTGGKRSRK